MWPRNRHAAAALPRQVTNLLFTLTYFTGGRDLLYADYTRITDLHTLCPQPVVVVYRLLLLSYAPRLHAAGVDGAEPSVEPNTDLNHRLTYSHQASCGGCGRG